MQLPSTVAGVPRGLPPARPTGAPQVGAPTRGIGQGGGQQERILMTLLTMLSQMPEAQVMLPMGQLTDLVEGGGMGSLNPSMVGGGGRGGQAPGLAGRGAPPVGARGASQPRPNRPLPQRGAVAGGMQRTGVPPRQGLGGAQPRGNAQALMRLLGGR